MGWGKGKGTLSQRLFHRLGPEDPTPQTTRLNPGFSPRLYRTGVVAVVFGTTILSEWRYFVKNKMVKNFELGDGLLGHLSGLPGKGGWGTEGGTRHSQHGHTFNAPPPTSSLFSAHLSSYTRAGCEHHVHVLSYPQLRLSINQFCKRTQKNDTQQVEVMTGTRDGNTPRAPLLSRHAARAVVQEARGLCESSLV